MEASLDELKKYLLLFFFVVFNFICSECFFPPSVTRESLIAFSLGVDINEVGEFGRVQFLF